MPSHRWLTDYGKSHLLGMHAESQRAGVKDGLKRGGLNKVISVWRILESQKETGSKPILDGYRIPFIFKSGGDGPGMGYRVNGAVVARALPEFATRQVVTCYDNWSRPTIITIRQPHPLAILTSSGRNRPSRVTPPIFHRMTKLPPLRGIFVVFSRGQIS